MSSNHTYQKQTRQLLQPNTAEEIRTFQQGKHYDKVLESVILGACLLEPRAFSRIYNMMEEDFFFDNFHKLTFTSLKEMFEGGDVIDLITVAHCLRKKKITEFGNDTVPYLLTGLMEPVVTTAHLEAHCLILREMYVERMLHRVAHSSFEGDALEKTQLIQAEIKRALSVQGVDDWRSIGDVMIALEKHRAKVKGKELMGVPTGFKTLDRITGGFQGGQIIVLGARPSVGKSAFIGGIAVNAAQNNYKVGVISLEMPLEQIGARFSSLYSDIEFYKIYQNKCYDVQEEKRLLESMTNIGSLPIQITDKTNVTAGAIRAKAEKLKQGKGLDLLIIDYLQLIETESASNMNREREISKLSRSLKLMAMDLNIPVMVLCQLNRESDKAGTAKKPRMSQIRESGSIEQDADLVMLLHRDWKSGILADEGGLSTENQANIIVEKNRNGETMDLKISFNPQTMKFFEPDISTPLNYSTPVADNPYSDGLRQAANRIFNEENPF